ncbi:hypothetical protein BC936DRAFT_138450 [Jimgerdemannia flammicorona]|uniref:Uncharacterized protein n=2 Tax=Jimgerdemannia flammicorona TaxID=994334 RepID=A0A433QTI9_9FUNG|nr:hypothetical protein BC936DRAFT_138450 [Jimgerdemannia flammicorona]RUS33103.1 hypothetical protein BC938DRAFT_473100 [Jimgerdemannia flammicorona]
MQTIRRSTIPSQSASPPTHTLTHRTLLISQPVACDPVPPKARVCSEHILLPSFRIPPSRNHLTMSKKMKSAFKSVLSHPNWSKISPTPSSSAPLIKTTPSTSAKQYGKTASKTTEDLPYRASLSIVPSRPREFVVRSRPLSAVLPRPHLLPRELWMDIFDWVYAMSTASGRGVSQVLKCASVCRDWNTLARSFIRHLHLTFTKTKSMIHIREFESVLQRNRDLGIQPSALMDGIHIRVETLFRNIKNVELEFDDNAECLLNIIASMRPLRELRLDFESFTVSDSRMQRLSLFYQHLALYCSNIKIVKLINCPSITLHPGLAPMLSTIAAPEIVILDWFIPDDSILAALSNPASIRQFEMHGYLTMETTMVPVFILCCPRLESFVIDNPSVANEEVLRALASSCPRLKHVSFVNCWQLRGESVENLEWLELDHIDLKGSPVSPSFIKLLMRTCPSLKTIELPRFMDNGRYCSLLEKQRFFVDHSGDLRRWRKVL